MEESYRFFQILENTLLGKIRGTQAIKEYNDMLKIYKTNHSKVNCILRALVNYNEAISSAEGWVDFFVNLRMVILTFNRNIKIGPIIKQRYFEYCNDLELNLESMDGNNYINVVKKKVKWIENYNDLDSLYDLDNRSIYKREQSIGDWRLKSMTGFNEYSSHSQKIIIRAIENQVEGSTILATMPTGGGKSLPSQFVSYFENSGTTIVVVPTIALAIDQCRSATKYFTGDRKVRAYYDGVSHSEKKKIIRELNEGKISMLYLSPESILNGVFNDEISRAATNGIVRRLVIDEAHIVAEWGEFFRTEFQFLALFRKKLLKKTNGRFKTILLSATVTENTEKVLKKLYSEGDNFIQIRGDALRNEITYYISRCKDDFQRKAQVLEMIDILPRPLIIYVPVIDKATEYYNMLLEKGYKRLQMFTSNTPSVDRENILRLWEEDKLDIIIATSAFGMGVNKKEVRAVIHTFIPESIDRFYQEVGRGGRDGFNSLSFIFTSLKDDEDYIKFFTRSKVLKVESIIERWYSILDGKTEQISGDTAWISVDAVPDRLKDSIATGSLNISWNEYVILFLYRQGIIDLLDMKINSETKKRSILVKVLRVDLVNNKELLYQYLEPIREKERSIVDQEIHQVKEMIKNSKVCWSYFFKNVYNTESKCNGCPVCRSKKAKKYSYENPLEFTENREILIKSFLLNRPTGDYILIHNNIIDFKKEILKECVNLKVDCFISEDTKSFCEMNQLVDKPIYMYSYKNFLEENEVCLISGVIAIVYGDDQDKNDKIYKKLKLLKTRNRVSRIVNIARNDIIIKSEGKKMSDLIDGTIKRLGGSNV